MKTPIAFILCLSLVLQPFRCLAPETNQPSSSDTKSVAVACVVIIVGGVIVYGLWKLCKKLDKMFQPPPPPPTNAPPGGTNTNHIRKVAWVMPRITMPETDIAMVPDWQAVVGVFQSSPDATNWTDCLYFTNWIQGSNVISVAADANGPLMTNWGSAPTPAGEVICDYGNLDALMPSGDKKFFRMVQLQ